MTAQHGSWKRSTLVAVQWLDPSCFGGAPLFPGRSTRSSDSLFPFIPAPHPPPSAPLLPAPDKPSRFCRRKATCLFTYLRRGHCFFLRETHKHLGPGPLLRLPGSPFAPTPTQSTRAATGSRHLKGKRGRANQKNWKKSGTTSNEGQKQVLCTSEESLN